MGRIIAIMNQKGGVGKTTTTVNLGHALALAGKKVTLLDMDPQGQVAISLGLKNDKGGLDRVLLEGDNLDDYLIAARDNLDVVCAGNNLADFEHVASGGSSRGHTLRRAIEASKLMASDFVLIDCPPSSGLLGINAMFAADELVIPVSGDYLSLQGLSRMMQILKRSESVIGHSIRLWIVSTRMQLRRRLTEEVRLRLLKYFPDRVLNTVIRENVSLAECPSFGKSVFEYKEKSAGAEDYQSLAQDLLSGRTG
jgi:chromosome partitioning protein